MFLYRTSYCKYARETGSSFTVKSVSSRPRMYRMRKAMHEVRKVGTYAPSTVEQ
jgi:hypothetical protein